jgi:DNA-binding transcriptional MerR regulator
VTSAPAPSAPAEAEATTAPDLRIGELARLAGTTTRTLRYWEEIGLLAPSAHLGNGERLYPPAALERVTHIRELQDLVGFSLAEIRAVLDTEEIFDQLRTLKRLAGPTAKRRLLLEEAVAANDRLIQRLDDRLERLSSFRDERVAKAARLRAKLDELGPPQEPKSGS